jgi:ABC-type Zn uptake system ZnuABC Zn-binding protein ZnuA
MIRVPTVLAALAFLAGRGAGEAQAQHRAQHRHGRHHEGTVRVVTTQPVYAALARAVGGEHVTVSAVAAPAEDPHFVRPKPSYAVDIHRADVFVTTGLDLELWVPVLLDKAGNKDVMEGGRGYVTAYTGIRLLEVPASADRSAGDVHVFGNPHLHTDPLRALQIARNIATGLRTVAPDLAPDVDRNLAAFADRLYRRLFGDPLVDLVGGELLVDLALSNRLLPFLERQTYEGRPLTDRLGGWMATAAAFRGREMICYHKNWVYFEERFGVRCAEYVEPKPGIPPTPGHVAKLIDLMHNRGLRVLFAASYFDRRKVESVAARGNGEAVIVPLNPGAAGVQDYFGLVDLWVQSLAGAFTRQDAAVSAGGGS